MLVEEVRATIVVCISVVMLLVTRVPDRELVQRAIPDDEEEAAIAISSIVHELKVRWRTRHLLEPSKRKLDLLNRMPATALDGVEESVREGVCDQFSPHTREEITAISVPAPAAAMPFRKDSFLETSVKKLVSF